MSTFEAWVGHTDDNLVNVLYNPRYDTTKGEIRALTKIIRDGNVVRGIRPEAMESIGKVWGDRISEARMAELAFPPAYDPDDGSAAAIATKLVEMRLGEAV